LTIPILHSRLTQIWALKSNYFSITPRKVFAHIPVISISPFIRLPWLYSLYLVIIPKGFSLVILSQLQYFYYLKTLYLKKVPMYILELLSITMFDAYPIYIIAICTLYNLRLLQLLYYYFPETFSYNVLIPKPTFPLPETLVYIVAYPKAVLCL
jgi:hypothetical protein